MDILCRAERLLARDRVRQAQRLLRPTPEVLRQVRGWEFLYWKLRGDCLKLSGELTQARQVYEKALGRFPASDRRGRFALLLELCDLSRTLGNLSASGIFLQKARSLASPPQRMDWRLRRGLLLRAQGRLPAARKTLRSSLREGLRRKDVVWTSYAQWALGGLLRAQGSHRRAERAFRHSLAWARKARDAGAAGFSLCGLGGAVRMQGRFRNSEVFYLKALAVFQSLGDRFGTAYAHCGLGNALRLQGRFSDALRHYLRSRRLYRGIGDRLDLAYVRWGEGMVFLGQGRPEKALPLFRWTLKVFRKAKEIRGKRLCLRSLAQSLWEPYA
ncbi:MAG: tetratricopeptide repeat protein [Elusimicrobia bacterium]|nr:tetratricopeptide repeat protein [Elusimicrobiota bacterium]